MRRLLVLLTMIGFLSSCQSEYTPKPRGFYRIDLPEKKYVNYSAECNFSFDVPVYAEVRDDSSRDSRKCWKNIVFPSVNGKIHMSYYDITSDKMFFQLIEDSRRLVFKHTVKADGIDESRITDKENKVYGLYYTIDGNAASSVQFFLTDSNKHFLRGALYFFAEPRADSLQPVIDFVKEDIDVMLKSFRWK